MGPHHQVRSEARARAALLFEFSIFAAALLLGMFFLLHMTSCARQSGARGEPSEIQLTRDGIAKHMVRFSPDGRRIAYSALPPGQKESWGIYVMPREGGESRRISPSAVGMFGLTWSADGKGMYAREANSDTICYVGLDGSVRTVDRAGPLTRVAGISADGKTELMLKFNGDNRDLGIREAGGKFQFLAPTPAWEEDAVFGPGPGQVTAVATPSYQAPVSTISIWSPQTRTFTPLPLPEGLNTQPAWSPGGRYLVYVSNRGSQSDLWVYDPRTARAAPLLRDPAEVGCPAWSPDGEWLALCRSNRTSHLFLGDPRKGAPRQLTEGAARDAAPAVSPDGKWVAFLRRPGGGAGQPGPVLCVMPSSGGPVAQLDLKGVQFVGKSSEALAWSRDCRRIAFQGLAGSGKTDIYQIGRDGNGLARVTVEPGDEVSPMWSPDGRYISYTKAGAGQLAVAAVPANGGLSRIVSQSGAKCEGGAWGPDSDHLAYLAYGGDGTYELWVTSLRHPETRKRLLAEKLMAWPAFWSRDGKEIVLARGSGDNWYYTAYALETGREGRIGRVEMFPSGKGEITDLDPQGEKYRDQFYPGGTYIFADGNENTDIYLVRARALLESRLLAGQGE